MFEKQKQEKQHFKSKNFEIRDKILTRISFRAYSREISPAILMASPVNFRKCPRKIQRVLKALEGSTFCKNLQNVVKSCKIMQFFLILQFFLNSCKNLQNSITFLKFVYFFRKCTEFCKMFENFVIFYIFCMFLEQIASFCKIL